MIRGFNIGGLICSGGVGVAVELLLLGVGGKYASFVLLFCLLGSLYKLISPPLNPILLHTDIRNPLFACNWCDV